MNPLDQKITVEQVSSLNKEQLSALEKFGSNAPSAEEFRNQLNSFAPKPLEHKAVLYWGKSIKRSLIII